SRASTHCVHTILPITVSGASTPLENTRYEPSCHTLKRQLLYVSHTQVYSPNAHAPRHLIDFFVNLPTNDECLLHVCRCISGGTTYRLIEIQTPTHQGSSPLSAVTPLASSQDCNSTQPAKPGKRQYSFFHIRRASCSTLELSICTSVV